MRITESLLVQNFLAHSRWSLSRLADAQILLSSGRRLHRPSDDPPAVAKLLAVRSDLREVGAYIDNASAATTVMSLVESSLAQVSDGLLRAKQIVLAGLNSTMGEAEREGMVQEARSLIESLMLVANAEHAGRYLFGGTETRAQPYATVGNSTVYRGNEEDIFEQIGASLRVALSLSGPDAFQTVPARVLGTTDLNPALSTVTALSDLRDGDGVLGGHIRITDSNGVTADLDLMSAETLRDILDGINGAGLSVSADISADGTSIVLTDSGGGSSFHVEDLLGGTLARDLGIAGDSVTGTITGADLDPAVTENTPLALLFGGAGIGPAAWTLRNDSADTMRVATIDPTQVNTVGELLDLIAGARTAQDESLGLWASIDHKSLAIESNRLHTRLSITDSGGGSSAAQFGVTGIFEAQDVFALLRDTADALASGETEELERVLQAISSAVNHTAGLRGTYGARTRQVLELAQKLQSENVDLTLRLSDIEDADLSDAAIQLTEAETVYQASLAASSRLLQMNLFNYIR
jgi:flagellin-like hook-associated protein FlgL